LKVEGWLLDIYPKHGEMVLWIKKRSGECIRLTERWNQRLYVAGNLADLMTLASRDEIADRCVFVEKYERLKDLEKSKVLQMTVRSDREAASLARRILRWGNYERYRLYNVDVPSSQMYLYEKDLFPLASIEATAEQDIISWRLLDRVEDTDYSLPEFRVARLSLETAEERRIRTFKDKLARITIGLDGESLLVDSGSEVEKLLKFIAIFNELDPDIVITEDGDSFLFPYLSHRAAVNEVLEELKLGREGAPFDIMEGDGRSYFSYGRIYYRSSAARLHGRIHIDEGNAYLYSDCGLEGLIEVARTCRIPLQRASRSTIGTSMTSLQLYQAVKDDILIPWNKNETEDFKDGLELLLADRGGFIFEPKTGIRDSVGEIDFTSLYPMLMMTKNLSAETVNCSCCPDSSNRVPELGYNICYKRTGIVPKTLRILLKKRAEYKRFKKEAKDPPLKEMYDRRQAALKWILVCS